MSKSLLGGGAAAALFSISLIFYAGPTVAEPLAQASQESSARPKTEAPVSTDRVSQTTTNASTSDVPSAARQDTSTKTRAPGSAQIQGQTASPAPVGTDSNETEQGAPANPSQQFIATAYCLRGRTASGRSVAKGIIAADRRVLPLGTRVRLDAGRYSGEYLVADTGGKIRGRKIDIWMPSGSEAMRFGRRPVKLTVLTRPGKTTAKASRVRK